MGLQFGTFHRVGQIGVEVVSCRVRELGRIGGGVVYRNNLNN